MWRHSMGTKYDNSVNIRRFRIGDIVRSDDDPDNCTIIWTWRNWLWLDPLDYRDAAPFTGRADDYHLVRSGDEL